MSGLGRVWHDHRAVLLAFLAFAGNLEAAGDLLSSSLGLVGGIAATLGLWLRASLRDHAH